jgi:hypothetical protein
MTTYDKKRLVGAAVMVLVTLTLVNSYFKFVLPSLARSIMAIGTLVGLIYITRCAPTQQDFEEHRRTKAGGLQ